MIPHAIAIEVFTLRAPATSVGETDKSDIEDCARFPIGRG